MKKLLTIVALSVALTGFSEDKYFYWMMPESVTLDGKSLEAGDYYAQIKTSDGTGYLNLYDEVGGETFGNKFEFKNTDASGMMFAGFNGETSSFLIELYNSSGLLGSTSLTGDLAKFITSGGMSQPVGGAYQVSSAFTAVPEPTSGLLLLLGVAGLALRRKNKKA